jgi:TetR/AcrR family transcriptional repressor of nem operon
MARPISYDPDVAVERARDMFWTRGYQAVSVDDLVKSTGLNRHSLYGRYGSKFGLLQATLHRYCDEVEHRLRAILSGPGTVLERLERLLSLRDPDCPDGFWNCMLDRGCFGFRMAAELKEQHPEIMDDVSHMTEGLRRLLTETIEEGQDRGEVRSDRSAEALASVIAAGFVAPLLLSSDAANNRSVLSLLN